MQTPYPRSKHTSLPISVSRVLGFVSLCGALSPLALLADHSAFEDLIRINQIGYLPDGDKVAVIADPQVGPDASEAFTPGSTYEVRRWSDDGVVFTGSPTVWNGGATHGQSGDRGWWFDFSALATPGSYYLWDVEREVGSYRFEISDTVYDEVLRVAVRMFFYQRCGFPKEAVFAGEDWADAAAFLHPGQDSEARSVYGQEDPSTERDLQGGWMDAGDYNKYVTFAEIVVHQLLHAWEERPEAFGDDLGIPESGNGLPDLLDEVRFQMNWLARMQEPDGGVLLKLGETDHSGVAPPSNDTRARFYVPACSSSTIAAAGLYAHAAIVFKQIPRWHSFAAELEQRAIQAWAWYHANPKSADCDEQIVKAGDADRSLGRQEESAVAAATYLHRLTGDPIYQAYVEDHYLTYNPFAWAGFSMYSRHLAEPLLHYMRSGFASPGVSSLIRQRVLDNENDPLINWTDQDLYRGYMPDSQYHWGSNSVKANLANASLDYEAFALNEADLPERRQRAENFLHNFLGLNPMGLVYLTRMESLGAEHSIQQIYHTWFAPGTQWDTNPPPGYVPGGPNRSYGGSLESLKGLPPQKSYLDFNDGWPENSWEISEPAIYYQSAFIKMLSKFVSPQESELDLSDSDADRLPTVLERWLGLNPSTPDALLDHITFLSVPGGLQMRFARALEADPFRIHPEWSGDLETWTPLESSDAIVIEATASAITLGYTLLSAEGAPVFVRFRMLDSVTEAFPVF